MSVLNLSETYTTGVLDNGIRVIHKEVRSAVAHCGFLINAGTRDEQPQQHGIAHFTEHLLFKGTRKRKAFHILSRMEDIGGELDAFTTKEETCITAGSLLPYFERAVELLNDVVFNSTFPEREMQKERDVIIDEINSYKDSPADNIFDDFEELLFGNHPLGRNILGTEKALKTYHSTDIKAYVQGCYNTDQMVFCSIGDISFDKVMTYCRRYFAQNPANVRQYRRLPFVDKLALRRSVDMDTHQTHCIMGTYAYSYDNPKRMPLFMLANLLAGPAMNSRLVMVLREKHGISYNIEANYTPYEDTGVFSIYFGVDKEKYQHAVDIIFHELKQLTVNLLGPIQLSKIKKQLIGQLAIGNEVQSNLLMSMGKSCMLFNQCDTLEKIVSEINSLTSVDLADVANEIFVVDKFSMLTYQL